MLLSVKGAKYHLQVVSVLFVTFNAAQRSKGSILNVQLQQPLQSVRSKYYEDVPMCVKNVLFLFSMGT